jgi:hypothetical protein
VTSQQEKKLADVLPRCRTLNEAERLLGGEFQGMGEIRDYARMAVAWGAFDGFHGRPQVHGGVPVHHAAAYDDAFAAGRRLATPKPVE